MVQTILTEEEYRKALEILHNLLCTKTDKAEWKKIDEIEDKIREYEERRTK